MFDTGVKGKELAEALQTPAEDYISRATQEEDAVNMFNDIAAKGLHVAYGLISLNRIERQATFYAFVTSVAHNGQLVKEENDRFERLHNSDPRFAERQPGPEEAYEWSDELSLEAMRGQPTFSGRDSLAEALGASLDLALYGEQPIQ